MALCWKVLGLLGIFLFSSSPLGGAVTKRFDGNQNCFLKYTRTSTSSVKERIIFHFKTIEGSGLILFAGDSSEKRDYMLVELVGGRIRYKGKFGARKEDDQSILEVFAGKNLGANIEHKVEIIRNGNEVKLIINNGKRGEGFMESATIAEGSFTQLSLGEVYIGGKPSQSFDSPPNYKGCLRDLTLDVGEDRKLDLLGEKATENAPGCVFDTCEDVDYKPFTFMKKDSELKFATSKAQVKGSFAFRSYAPNGILLQEMKTNKPIVKIYYSASSVHLEFYKSDGSFGTQKVDKRVHGGIWHTVRFSVSKNSAAITVDGGSVSDSDVIDFTDDLLVGGNFVGCMKDLVIGGKALDPSGATSASDVADGMCLSHDLCTPNPCLNGGICTQEFEEVTCKCTTGQILADNPVCQFAVYRQTCSQILKEDPTATSGEKMIDPDNSGPLPAKKVRCDMTKTPPETIIDTVDMSEKPVKSSSGIKNVKVSYKEVSADWANALALRSDSCKQLLGFKCKNSRLFSPDNNFADWVAHGGSIKTYWGGATQSGKCACAATDACVDGKNCNCYEKSDTNREDKGDLTDKLALPVVEVNFEDVGPDSDSYLTVGNLICAGDGSPNNVVTFVYEDSQILLTPWKPAIAGDISFDFKTAYTQGILLYTEGTSGHFFKLKISGEKTMEVHFNVGDGDRSFKVTTKTPINNLEWHSVHVYRNVKEFGLIVDGEKNTETVAYKYLNVQENLSVGFFWEEVLQGFVGCMRDMFINGVFVDLVRAAKIDNKYFKSGCKGQCTPATCTFGDCEEMYNTYECDCSKTPYQGYSCHKEIKGGTFLDGHDGIVYNSFKNSFPSSQLKIVLGFKATACADIQTLLFIESEKNPQQYYAVELSAGGKLEFSFYFTKAEKILLGDKDLCDNERHTVYIYRNGNNVTYRVDKESGEDTFSGDNTEFDLFSAITVGKHTLKGQNFKGCLSGVGVDIIGNSKSEDFQPLSWYFNQYGGSKDKNIKEGSCFEEPVPAVGPPEKYVPTPSPRKRGSEEGEPVGGRRTKETDDNAAVIIIVVLLLVLLIVALLAAIVWFMVKNKGVYHTHEGNDEELKLDDQNVALAGSQPGDGKKKEWYI